tara:strand:+ start:2042 stop:4591 length:2550 start_codon:yes stop_codon:yes gene_type:complete
MKSSDNTLLLAGLFVLIVVIIALIVYYTRPGETKTPDQTSDTTELKIENLSLTRTLNPDPSVGNGVSGYTIEPYGIEYDTGKADYNELSKNVTFTMNWSNAPGFTRQEVKGFKIEHFVKKPTDTDEPTVAKQTLIKQEEENSDTDKDNINIKDFGECRAKIVSDNTFSVIGQNSFKLYAVLQKNENTEIDWTNPDTQEYILLYNGIGEKDAENKPPAALKISKDQLSVTLEMTTPDSLTFTPSGFEASTRAVISKTTYNVSSTQGILTKSFPGYSGGVYLTTLSGSGGKRFYFTFEDGFILMLNSDGTFTRKKVEDSEDEIFIFEIVDREKTIGKIRQAASRFLGASAKGIGQPETINTETTPEKDRKYLSTDGDGKLKLYKQQDSDLTATIFAGFDWKFNERISKSLPFPTGEFGTGGDVVCIYGDDAFIGQPYHGSNTGRVLIYKRNSTGKWDYKKKIDSYITGTDPASDREFGCSVSISKDFAVIGEKKSPGKSNKQKGGRVYILQRDADGNWETRNTKEGGGIMSPLQLGGNDVNGFFGSSVAISDPILPQNKTFLVVGAPGDAGGKINIYQLSKYESGGISWSRMEKIDGKTVGERFGHAVDISGDRVIVGAPNANKVFIYEINPNAAATNSNFLGLKGIITGQSKSGDTNVNFGISVAIQDDVAVVGAPGYNAKKGVVYVFKRGNTTNMANDNGEGGGWRMNASGLNNFGNADIPGDDQKMNGYTEARIDGTVDEELGRAIGISGNKLIIGSVISNKVRVYTRTQKTASSRHRWNDVNCVNVDNCASLTKARVFEPPPKRYNESDLKFGTAVSIDGDYAMIGEPGRKVEGASGKVGATYITTV